MLKERLIHAGTAMAVCIVLMAACTHGSYYNSDGNSDGSAGMETAAGYNGDGDTGSGEGSTPAAGTGYDTRYGIETGSEYYNTESGTEYGTDAGSEYGAQTGAEYEAEPGSVYGMETGSGSGDDQADVDSAAAVTAMGSGRPAVVSEVGLKYARQFKIEELADGASLVTVAGEETLVVPKDMEVPSYAGDMRVIRQGVGGIYLAATSTADLFLRLGAIDNIGFISISMENLEEESLREAMEAGSIRYAGKYSAPDYELLYAGGCPLVIESTMILHKPEVREQLEELGIAVFMERSSYESHPLGRAEWIRLYGLLTGREEEADAVFEEACESYERVTERVEELIENGFERPAVAYFYINDAGVINIHKPGGYMSALIEAAGGDYFADPSELDQDVYNNALSTMNIQMEDFYVLARDADILIYNGNYESGLKTVEQLVEKNGLLSQFKAVQNGKVWCSEKNMFQQSGAAGEVAEELFGIFAGDSLGTADGQESEDVRETEDTQESADGQGPDDAVQELKYFRRLM